MNKSERIAGVILLAIGVAVAVHSYAVLELGEITTPDAGFMPFILGIILSVLSLFWLFQLKTAGGKSSAANSDKSKSLRLVLAVGLIFVYAWLFERIGYLTSTLFFMGSWQIFVEREKIWKMLVIAGCSTLCLFLLFSELLKVPLPQELFLR